MLALNMKDMSNILLFATFCTNLCLFKTTFKSDFGLILLKTLV